MTRIAIVAKGLAVGCAVMAGAGGSVWFMQDLLPFSLSGETMGFSDYASLVSDFTASLMAGFLLGWLVYFCLWDCLAVWLGNFWAYMKKKLRVDGKTNRAQGVEQTG